MGCAGQTLDPKISATATLPKLIMSMTDHNDSLSVVSPGGRGWGAKLTGSIPSRVQGRSLGVGLGPKPQEAEKHDINLALRVMLVNAYLSFYSSYILGFSGSSHISYFQSTQLVSHPHCVFTLLIGFAPIVITFSFSYSYY